MSDASEVGGIFHGTYKAAIELVCGAVDIYAKSEGQSQEFADIVLFELAKAIKMKPEGRAAKFLDHFLFGNGAPIEFDCATLIKEDCGVRQRVQTEISKHLHARSGSSSRIMSGGQICHPNSAKGLQSIRLAERIGLICNRVGSSRCATQFRTRVVVFINAWPQLDRSRHARTH